VYSLNPETMLANNLACLLKKWGVGAASVLLASFFFHAPPTHRGMLWSAVLDCRVVVAVAFLVVGL